MSFESLVVTINDFVWGLPLVILALGTGIYFSVRTGFLQIRFLKEMVRLLLKGKESEKGVSSFQAGNEALIVVDGFPLEGGLESLNPNTPTRH